MSPLDIVLPIRVRRIERKDAPASDAATHANGYQAGYAEGRLRAEWESGRDRAKNNARVQTLAAALEKLHGEYETLLEEHLPDLIQGALGRVFRRHPFTTEEIAAEIAVLLREMEQAGRIALECSPGEAAELRRNLEACETVPGGVKWTLAENSALASGEFQLKSDLGDVDGRHSTRLRKIRLALEAQS